MNPKIEVIKRNILTENGFEEFSQELKQFAEAHKVVNVSIAVVAKLAAGGAEAVIATILYEWKDNTINL
jgi:hypothetical protein